MAQSTLERYLAEQRIEGELAQERRAPRPGQRLILTGKRPIWVSMPAAK